MVMGSEKSKNQKAARANMRSVSQGRKKIKKNQKTKGNRRHLSLPQEAVVAPTALPKKR
jgi:hypothetical protein